MVGIEIAEVVERFDPFRVAVIVAEDLAIEPGRSQELDAMIRSAEQETVSALADKDLGKVREIACWRQAYRAFGVKKTSYRSSVERLVKAVIRRGALPQVLNLVDAYNLVSLRYLMPVGADDLDCVDQPLSFRYARPEDTFVALGDETRSNDPPLPNEVVYADSAKCLCRRWNWYQDARSAISSRTRGAVLTIQALDPDSAGRVEEAADVLCDLLLSTVCRTKPKWGVADRGRPEVILN